MRLLLALPLVLTACATAPVSNPPTGSLDRPGPVPTPPAFEILDQDAGTAARLIGSHAVDADVVWLSGTDGTVVRTTDGGATWTATVVPGADTLQFRDIHAFDDQTAWALSIGPGEASRILKTTDEGATWRTVFVNNVPEAFFDCLAFWTPRFGVAFSDSFDGEFYVITTVDGGESWQPTAPEDLPDAAPGEGGFAASGTCVTTRGRGLGWIATGNAAPARVLRTNDRGAHWIASELPIVAGEAAGATSVVFRDDRHGVALGGDIARPDSLADTVARTEDGGATWTLAGAFPHGAVYGAAYVPETEVLVATGPGGVALSRDDGRTWAHVDRREFWGVTAASADAIWLVGPDGRVARLVLGAEGGG